MNYYYYIVWIYDVREYKSFSSSVMRYRDELVNISHKDFVHLTKYLVCFC